LQTSSGAAISSSCTGSTGQTVARGVFSTRSPNRPNPLGFGVVDLVAVDGGILRVRGLDALDGTPLIDIKPYSSEVDAIEGVTVGWMKNMRAKPGT
jgi:formylmethanofuran dehydrogenase subunit E